MTHPNFVHDLVLMAKAFEELPQVRALLDESERARAIGIETIQRLEMRIIDLKTELDAAHEATRKAEVERDHAERMFLETDDRLNAFRNLVQHFRAEVETFDAAMAPQEPEPSVVAEPTTQDHAPPLEYKGQPLPVQYQDAPSQGQSEADPTTALPTADGPVTDTANQSAAPTPTVEPSTPANTQTGEGVSVPTDPTQPTPATESFSGSVSQDLTPSEAPQPDQQQLIAEDTAPTPSAPSAPMQPEPPLDDVGYHNEPNIKQPDGTVRWEEWDDWSQRMNARYGINGWPARPQAAQ